MERRIIILKGEKRTGKTTALTAWMNDNPSIGGILTPDNAGLRVAIHYPKKKIIPLQTKTISDNTISIGRFHFLKSGFEGINELLIEDAKSTKLSWVVFDEIGPLELDKKGLFPALTKALEHFNTPNLLLVVREDLINEVISAFKLTDVEIIKKEGLEEL